MKKILVVDDDKLNLMMADRFLKGKYEVLRAGSGEIAFQVLRSTIPDLILLDISMPKMDGFEVIAELKKQKMLQDIPVIFLTATTDEEAEQECFRAGAEDFVRKPFVADVLLERVENTLAIKEQNDRDKQTTGAFAKQSDDASEVVTAVEDNREKGLSLRKVFSAAGCLWKELRRIIGKHFDKFIALTEREKLQRMEIGRMGFFGISLITIVLLTWFALEGGDGGFGILWILLVPSFSMLALGLVRGTILSAYFLIFLVAVFNTPLEQIMKYKYDAVFVAMMPILYLVDYVGAFVVFYKSHCYEIENEENKNKLLSYQSELETTVKMQTRKTERFSMQVVMALARTIDAKDQYTKGHSNRVAEYARMIAKRMGKTEKEQSNVYYIGLLHDIGKIGVPGEIINKTSKLTDEEYAIIKKHPAIGYDILKAISEMPEIGIGAKWHHERYDGKGYPDGLRGDEIPEIARIIGVADAYDAMASTRSYRDVLPQEVVRSEIEKGRGTQFDPEIADIMLALIAEDPEYRMREKKNGSDSIDCVD